MKWITFIWKQLNGPQITAIVTAIWEYWTFLFEDILEYWRNLSISTSKSEHLSTIGTLMGFPRPLSMDYDEDLMLFTVAPTYYNRAIGLSNIINGIPDLIGGTFDRVDTALGVYHPLSDEWYRPILQLYSLTDAELGSLNFIDQLCQLLAQEEEVTVDHSFLFVEAEQSEIASYYLTYGDVIVDFNNITWPRPASVLMIMNAVINSFYSPLPFIYPYINI